MHFPHTGRHEDCRHRFAGRGDHGRFGQGWRDDHGHGRRRRVFDSSDLRLVLLKLIADEPRHGYELIRAIEDLSGGSYVPSPGVIYPTLTMLQDMRHIEEAKSEGARRAYAVTAEGSTYLEENAEEVVGLFQRLAQLAAKQEQTDAAPIRRAMENLRAVLRHRLGRGDVRTETLHDVAAILDDAAQRIERL